MLLAYVKSDTDLQKLSIEVEGKQYVLKHEPVCLHDSKGEYLRN